MVFRLDGAGDVYCAVLLGGLSDLGSEEGGGGGVAV